MKINFHSHVGIVVNLNILVPCRLYTYIKKTKITKACRPPLYEGRDVNAFIQAIMNAANKQPSPKPTSIIPPVYCLIRISI